MQPLQKNRQTSVASGFVKGITAGLMRFGVRPQSLLDRAGIATLATLSTLRAPRIPLTRYTALYRLINETLDDEGFGLFARPLRRGAFELLCRGALSAATLDEALARMSRHLRVLLDEFSVTVERDGASALLVIRQQQALPAGVGRAGRVFAHEWLLRMIHGLAAWLVARPLVLDAAAFPYPPPAHAADYELVFAPRCAFNAKSKCLVARFAAAQLAWPVRRDEAALREFLVAAPASITALYRRERQVSPRVRELLRAALPAPLSLAEVAARLFVSARTLHRRLEAEGSSLSQLRAALRRDLAIEQLTKTSLPVARIGADLGYADTSAFYRAFTQWTGSSPRAYRIRRQGSGVRNQEPANPRRG